MYYHFNHLSQKVRTVNLAALRSRPHRCSEGVNHWPGYSPGSKMGHHIGGPKLHRVDAFILPTTIGFRVSTSAFFYSFFNFIILIIASDLWKLYKLRIRDNNKQGISNEYNNLIYILFLFNIYFLKYIKKKNITDLKMVF